MMELLEKARDTKRIVSRLSESEKNRGLMAMAQSLERHAPDILAANALDMEEANGRISPVMLDRLKLTEDRIQAMAKGIREVVDLPDPVGRILEEHIRPDGLKIQKVSVPMGVIAIIYESRPNVTSDAAALALKSGNVCVLRSGRDAIRSAGAIVEAMQAGLRNVGLPESAVLLVKDTSHDGAKQLMTANGYIDLLIPRGGAGLIHACLRTATVPCIATGTGICHVYVEETADQDMALNIVENAKTSRPSVCNAEEVLLVDEAIAQEFLPKLRCRLTENAPHPVELRLCPKAAAIIPGTPAGEKDFDTEFLDYILAVKVVSGMDEAIAHIAAHSTGHSEAIVTKDAEKARLFTECVDSAAVYVNASTRFTDGGEFGLGCEMGISTQKLHARGPMGLRELTTYHYCIYGNGQTR